MTELKKILLEYSPNTVMLGGEENESEEAQNAKIDEMRVSLENLIKKETKKLKWLAWFYVILIILAVVMFLYEGGVFEQGINRLASFVSITGATPIVLYSSMKQLKQKVSATIVLEMTKKMNKETLNSALNIIIPSIK